MPVIDYVPPPTIKKYILDTKQVKVVSGCVGSGKSTGCIFNIVYEGLKQSPGPDGVRRSRYAVVRNTNQQLMDTTFKSFNAFFKDGEAGVWKATEKTFLLRPATNVEIEVMFRPLDTEQDIARLLSLELSGIWFNEAREINHKVFLAAMGRVGRYPSKAQGGCDHPIVLLDTNPPEEGSWLWEMMEEPPETVAVYKQPPALIPGTREVNPDAENLENLPANYYQLQLETAGNNDEYINVYLRNMYGRTNAGKAVFPMFSESRHVSTTPLKPNPLLPLYIGFDPGLSSGLVFAQLSLHGQLLIYDALATTDMGTERLFRDRVKPLIAAKYRGFETIVLPDPAANTRSNQNEDSHVRIIRSFGHDVKFPDMNNQLEPRLQAVDSFLSRSVDVGPALLIDKATCKPLIDALAGGYRYPLAKPGSTEKLTPEKNAASHIADSLQYLARYLSLTEARQSRRKAFTDKLLHNSVPNPYF